MTGLSPAGGSTFGGTSVIITGTGFTGATNVSFGGIAATSFTVNSATQITAVDPAAAAGAIDVQVTSPSTGASTASSLDQFLYTATNTTTTVSNAAATYGGSTTLSANVTANSPSTAIVNEGTVTFTLLQGGAIAGSVTSGTVTGGVATASLSVTGLSAGTYSIQATYSPASLNPNFAASTASVDGTLTISSAPLPAWVIASAGAIVTWTPGTDTLLLTSGAATIVSDPESSANGNTPVDPNIVVSPALATTPALLTIAPTTSNTAIHIGGLTLDPGGSIDMPSVEGAGMDGINGVERAQGANNVLVLGSVSAVTAESVNDNVVTLTANNDFQVGQMVDVGGTTATPGETDNAYDGTFPITAATPTSFSYDATGPNLSTISVAGGTLPAGASASTQASDPTFSIDNTQAVTAPITSATWSGTTVTIQASGNYTVGQMVTIAGVSTSGQIFSSDFSGGHQITGIVSGGFTFTSQNAPASGSSGTADLDDATVSRISNLNLEDNDMIVHGGNNDPAFDGYATDSSLFSGVQTAATIGRNGTNGSGGGFLDGTWDGNGLTSSAAANEAAYQGQEYTALGVVLNAELPTPFTSWDVGNEPMRYDGNDAIVKYTYVGDWTLQGTVNDNDYNIMVSNLNYSNAIPDWANGSYNGGAVDDNAYNVFLSVLNNGITNGDPL